MLDFFLAFHYGSLSHVKNVSVFCDIFWTLCLKSQFLQVQGLDLTVTFGANCITRRLHDSDAVVLEEGTVQNDRFVLATLTTDMEPIRRRIELAEVSLQLGDRFPQVLSFQAQTARLHQPRIHIGIDHLLEQGILLSQPKIR